MGDQILRVGRVYTDLTGFLLKVGSARMVMEARGQGLVQKRLTEVLSWRSSLSLYNSFRKKKKFTNSQNKILLKNKKRSSRFQLWHSSTVVIWPPPASQA